MASKEQPKSAPEDRPKAAPPKRAKKVLVQSAYREVLAVTGRRNAIELDGQGHPRVITKEYTRQFLNYRAYMSAEEARFLVESAQNKALTDAHRPGYFYPSGLPVDVNLDFEEAIYGVYTGPVQIGEGSGVDARATAGAQAQIEQQASVLKNFNERVLARSQRDKVDAETAARLEAAASPPVAFDPTDEE